MPWRVIGLGAKLWEPSPVVIGALAMDDSNENNPYARSPDADRGKDPLEKKHPGNHEVTINELKAANKRGNVSPAAQRDHSDAEIMSGKEDRAGIPMTIAAADATENNDRILGKHEQEVKVGHATEDGRFVKTPPNTPSV